MNIAYRIAMLTCGVYLITFSAFTSGVWFSAILTFFGCALAVASYPGGDDQ